MVDIELLEVKDRVGKANALEDMSMIIDADVYLVSHSHLPLVMKKSFLDVIIEIEKVTQVDKLFVNSNAFLKYGGYAENYGYHPTSTQYPKIILDGIKRDSKNIIVNIYPNIKRYWEVFYFKNLT